MTSVRVRLLILLATAGFALAPQQAQAAISITSPAAIGPFLTGGIQFPLQATGNVAPVTWSVMDGSTLPPGIALRTDVPSNFPTGAVAGLIGVATTPGIYTFTLSVTDGSTTATQAFTMTIAVENFQDLGTLPDALVNSANNYSYTFTVLNGTSPSIALASGSSPLPPGLTLTSGTLSGTPTTAGSYTFKLQITDGALVISRNFNLFVSALAIATPGLPNGTQGASYNMTLAATGGSGGYSYQVTNGGLPPGLSLSSGGTISGTINSNAFASTYDVSITVTDSSSNSYQQQFSLDVLATPEPVLPNIPVPVLNDATVGNPYSGAIRVNGGVASYTWNVTGLPTGMFFRTGAGNTSSYVYPGQVEIWGVPQTAGTYNVTYTATDANGSSVSITEPFHVSVLAQTTGLPNPALDTAYTQTLRILGGQQSYTAALTGGSLPNGLTLAGLTVAGTPRENGNFNFTVTFTDSTSGTPNTFAQNFYIFVSNPAGIQINNNAYLGLYPGGASNTIDIGLNACCDSSGFVWSVSSGTLPSGLSLNASTGVLSGTASPNGTFVFTVEAANSTNLSSAGFRQFTIVFTPLVITTNSLPIGNLSTSYNGGSGVTFTSTGGTGAVTWSIVPDGGGLPPGLTLSGTGLLSGTPTSTGAYYFTVNATDSVGNYAHFGLGISVYPAGSGPPVFISNGASFGTVTTGDLELDLYANGGNGSYTWSVLSGSLPPGLTIRPDVSSNAVSFGSQAGIIGVATTPGNYNFTLQVMSAGKATSQAFTLNLSALNLADPYTLPQAYTNVEYNYTLTPIEAAASPTFTYAVGGGTSLPAGLSLNSSTGAITGKPTAAGNFNFNITVGDGTSTITRYFNIAILNIDITTSPSLANATQGASYSTPLAATGGTGAITFSAGNLPPGLSIVGNAITGMVGTNAGPGLYNVNINATDGTNTTSENFALDVIAITPQLTRLNPFNFNDPTVGDPYNADLAGVCCGGTAPFTWAVTGGSLPPGMFLRYAGSGTAGTASGTPASYTLPGNVEFYGVAQSAGDYPVTLTVTDVLGNTTSQALTIHVSPLDDVYLPNGTIGVAYPTTVLRLDGGASTASPTSYSILFIGGALPAGMSITSNVLSGTPIESGNFNFTLKFTDTASTPNTLTRFYSINIANAANTNLQIYTSSPLPSQVTGSLSNFGFNACCATGYIWSVASGTFPPGLSLNSSTGGVSGTSTTSGNYTFLIKVADSTNSASTAFRQFTVNVSSLQITTSSIPFGNLSSAYGGSGGVTLTATGGTGSYTWSLASGSFLPPGVTLSSGGVISGTPTSTGQYYPIFTVTDSGGNTHANGFELNVYPVGGEPPLVITTGANLGTWELGEDQIQLFATGGTGSYTWSVATGSTLPPGFALRTDTPSFFSPSAAAGLIGVATTPGIYTFTLNVTSGSQTVGQAFTMNIPALNIMDEYNLPDAYAGQPYSSYQMTAQNPAGTPSFSVNPSTCAVSSPTHCLPPGLAMATNGTISGTPMAGSAGSYNFNVVVNDGTSTIQKQYFINTYAIQIATAGVLPNATQGSPYSSVTFNATGGTGSYTWTANGLPGGFAFSSGGVLSLSGNVTAGPGIYYVNVTATDTAATSSVKRFMLDVIGVPLTLPELNGFGQDATIGDPYSLTLNIGNGGTAPFTYTATGLPPGMSIRTAIPEQNNGEYADEAELWGAPTATGTYNIAITATDATGVTTTIAYPFHVSALVRDPGFPNGAIGSLYDPPSGFKLRVVGGTGPYTITSLPALGLIPGGLTYNAATQILSGTPTESGGFSLAFNYSDSAGNSLTEYTGLNISNGTSPLNINDNGNLGTVSVNSGFNFTLGACCTPNPIVWSVASGTLPTGITLNSSTGLLSGTPTVDGTYTFLIEANDSVVTSTTAFRRFTMVVTPISVTSNTNLTYANDGSTYSQTITTSGGTGTVTWALSTFAALPPGLTLTGSTISGTPTATGEYFFNLTGTDSSGNTIVRTFNVNIYPMGAAPPLFLGVGPNLGPLTVGIATFQLNASGGFPPYTYSLTPSATVVPGCRVQNGQPLPTNFPSTTTGGYLCLVTTPGTTSTSIRVTDSMGNTFDRAVSVIVSPLTITNVGTLPKAYVGESPYNFQLTPTGGSGAYTFSATGLPTGMSVDSSSGLIGGTPSVSGNFSPTITLGNASVTGTVGIGFSLSVNPFPIATAGVLPEPAIGSTYSQTFSAPGCGTSCTWSVVSGSLPSGFSLSSGGVLSTGSATVSGTYNSSFTVQASGPNGVTQQIFYLIIPPNTITPLSITTSISQTLQVGGTTFSTMFASGGTPPYTFSLQSGSLPPGFILNTGSGDQFGGSIAPGTQNVLGRATTVGTYNYTVEVMDSKGLTAAKALTLTTSPMSIQYTGLPLTGTLLLNSSYTQPLLVIGGTGTYPSWVNQLPFQPGLTLNASTGVISGTPTNTGNLTIPVEVQDNAPTPDFTIQNVSINVVSSTSGNVTLGGPAYGTIVPLGATNTFTVNPSGGTGPYTLSGVGTLPAGVIVESGSSLGSSFGSGAYGFQVLFSNPGTYTFTLQATDSSSPALVGERTYTLVVPAYGPVQTTTLPNESVSTSFSIPIYSFDNSTTVTWSIASGSALPPGLSISPSGVLTGTPTAAGTYSFTLSYGDGSSTETANFTLKISPLTITNAGLLPLGANNVAYGPAGAGVTLTATGGSGTTAWSVTSGSLPDGMTLSGTGLISGSPDNGTGTYVFTVNASNTGGSVAKQFTLIVGQTNPTVLDFPLPQTTLPDATQNQTYTYQILPDGGVPGYTWSSTTLPAGLSLLSGSSLPANFAPGYTVLAGQPTTAGKFTFNMTVTDSTGATATRTFTLNVSPMSITSGNPRNATQGVAYSEQIQASGGIGPYTFSAVTNILGQDLLPAGLTLSSSGLIGGTPTGTGTFTFILTVTDSASPAHTLTRTMQIVSLDSFGTQVTTTNMFSIIGDNAPQSCDVGGNTGFYLCSILPVSPAPASPIVQGLPPGITLDSSGEFDGHATTPGIYQFVLQAVNPGNSSDAPQRTITWLVSPIQLTAPVQNSFFSNANPSGTVGSSYSFTFKAAGGKPPYTYTETPLFPLPPGLTLSSTGVLSGTPTQSGAFDIKPLITDANGAVGSGNYPFSVTAAGKNPVMNLRNSLAFSDASTGVAYSLPLDRIILGGVPPYTWTVTSGSLPPGLSIIPGANGVSNLFAGTPTTPGSSNFALNVSDSSGQTLSVPGGFNVSVLSLSPFEVPNASVGSPTSVTFAITGGTPPYNIQSVDGSTAPPGLSLTQNTGSTFAASGTPTYSGVFPVGFEITDSAAVPNSLTQYYEFDVDDAAGETPSVALAPNPVNILFIQGTATTSSPITVSSSSGSLAFNAALFGNLGGATLSAASGSTNASLNLNFGAVSPGTYSGFLSMNGTGAVNYGDTTPVNLTVLAPPPCTYTLSPGNGTSPIGGDSGNFSISTGPTCTWSAAADPSATWLTLTGSTSGTGLGTVAYSAAENDTGSARSANITVTGSTGTQTFTLNQFAAGCSYSISPSVVSATAAGGSATTKVTASGSTCAWTASSTSGLNPSPTGPTTGSGYVSITIPQNTNAASQMLTATVAGQTLTVNQSGASCNYSLSATNAVFDSTGGSGAVNITATSGCAYSTLLGPTFISVTSGGAGTGTGSPQTITYTVAPNSTTQALAGALIIGGLPFQINESALACSISLDTSTLGSPFAVGGGSGTIGIMTNGSNCAWNAASAVPFATVSPATGYGNGSVSVTVTSNASSTTTRMGSLTVAGQTVSFMQGGTVCSYMLLSPFSNLPASGGLGTASVVAPAACTWSAMSNSPGITIIASGSGGTADVSFTVAPNTSALPQSGTITIAGQTFTVNEAGAPCTFTLGSSSSGTIASGGASGLTVGYTASTTGCTFAVTSYAGWITVDSNSFTDPTGTVTYDVAPNPSGATRMGNIQIGDQVFTVTQTGSACVYSLSSYGAVVNHLGAIGDINGAANLGTCMLPTPGATLPFITAQPATGSTSLFMVPYTVMPFSSATNTVRVGTITVGGQNFVVKQTSY